MEREGAEVSALRPTLEARASSYGPEDPQPPAVHTRTAGGKKPHPVDIQTRQNTKPPPFHKVQPIPSPFRGIQRGIKNANVTINDCD